MYRCNCLSHHCKYLGTVRNTMLEIIQCSKLIKDKLNEGRVCDFKKRLIWNLCLYLFAKESFTLLILYNAFKNTNRSLQRFRTHREYMETINTRLSLSHIFVPRSRADTYKNTCLNLEDDQGQVGMFLCRCKDRLRSL